ncbi:MAG: hypothetical protein JO277_10400 [Candidatus Eremiobacteraeota bacterium]|nr:hypothetical protein [Candidatus Eremiobacteraeota bacterium]
MLLTLAVSSLSACTTSGGSAVSARAALPALRPSGPVHGVIKDKHWLVPEAETLKVDGNLAVFASQEIDVEGALEIEKPGISLALFAPTIIINGGIGSGYKGTTLTGQSKVADVISGCDVRLLSASRVASAQGDDLAVSASGPACRLYVGTNSALGGGLGLDGTAQQGLRDATDGGSLYVGTKYAIDAAEHLARGDGVKRKAYEPATVVLGDGAILYGGSGGNGGSVNGVYVPPPADRWIFQPGIGGDGGSVFIAAGKLEALPGMPAGAIVAGGNGGTGGGAALSKYDQLNGTSAHADGYDAKVIEGSGGQGGSVDVASNTPNFHYEAGNGGNAGTVTVAGGNGAQTPVGNGGNLTLNFGLIGDSGEGTRNPRQEPHDGAYPPITFVGGEGGTAPNGTTAAGGNGGTLTVFGPGKVLPQGYQVTIGDFGDAGFGQSACGSAGARGGNGGNLTLEHGVTLANIDLLVGHSYFNGGNGGFGTPPGSGGTGGIVNTTGAKIGQDGMAGSQC